MCYFHFTKLHRRVAKIVHHRVTSGDRTHLLFWSCWKPAAGGDHGVSVFLSVCCLLFAVLCSMKWQLVKNWVEDIVGVVAPLVWWVCNKLSYIGFSIENKMADLSLTAIRVPAGTKNSRPVGFYSRNSMESTVDPNTTIPQTSPPWWCRLPLLRCGNFGYARSDAVNLF